MPCYDPRDNEPRVVYRDGYDHELQRQYNELADRFNTLKRDTDNLTRMLCAVGRARKHKIDIPAEVLNWWARHCHIDTLRGEPW